MYIVLINCMDSLKDRLDEIEREEIINALIKCNWVMAKAARKLGITERMIAYKVKKYGIRKEDIKICNKKNASDNRKKQVSCDDN